MANPQPTDAHLRLAHELLEEIISCDFTKRQLKLILLVLRLSWGCRAGTNRKHAVIPKQKDFEVAGVLETHITKELKWLIEAKVLTADGGQYQFNKNYDEWRVSHTRAFDRQRLTELVSLNLNNCGTYQNGKSAEEELTETVSDTYQNGKFDVAELTKTVSGNLLKREVSTYQNSKFATPDLATAKEILNKVLKKEYTDNDLKYLDNFIVCGQQSLMKVALGLIGKFEWNKHALETNRRELIRVGLLEEGVSDGNEN